MRRANRLGISSVALLASCVLPTAKVSPYGRPSTVYTHSSGDLEGELLAAQNDSLWLLSYEAVRVIPMRDVRKLTVQRHDFDAGTTVRRAGAIGLGTGLALTVACAQYEGRESSGSPGSCIVVLPIITAVFSGIGGLLAISNSYSSDFHLDARDSLRLKAFARFPQGMPPGFRPSAVTKPETP